ncbi:hypothetical protein C1646_811818 [Rhizophagus diaphanus]|nr:hypothetical protein C1646_811818 [Rhizophagus diaphanus] [Rhizophagus sp. MUCL 43196]
MENQESSVNTEVITADDINIGPISNTQNREKSNISESERPFLVNLKNLGYNILKSLDDETSVLGSQIPTALSDFFGGSTLAVLSDFLAVTGSFGFPWYAALWCGFQQIKNIFFEPPDVGLANFEYFLDVKSSFLGRFSSLSRLRISAVFLSLPRHGINKPQNLDDESTYYMVAAFHVVWVLIGELIIYKRLSRVSGE